MTTFTIKHRRDTSWRWEIENPVLVDGELGFEINTGKFKMGDGTTHWLDLEYFLPENFLNGDSNGEPTPDDTLPEHINSPLPHPVYDNGPSLELLYQNAKV